jgi:hypothetical protein
MVVPVGGGPGEVVLVVDGEGPAGAVGDAVVVSAEQGEVVEVGWAAVLPVVDVVGVAPLWWCVAAWEGAAAVACGEGAALAGGGVAFAVSECQRDAVGVELEDRVVGVAGGEVGVVLAERVAGAGGGAVVEVEGAVGVDGAGEREGRIGARPGA